MQSSNRIPLLLARFSSASSTCNATSARSAYQTASSTSSARVAPRIISSKASIANKNFKRCYSSSPAYKCLSKSDVQTLLKDKPSNLTLIDVREPAEVQLGKLPGAQNIPVGNLPTEFAKSDASFKASLGFAKPKVNDKIIVYCKSGMRANGAASYLVAQGYTDVNHYPGYIDWFGKGY